MIVIYIKPDDLFNNIIFDFKRKIIKKYKYHLYAEHEPHCTIISSKKISLKNLQKNLIHNLKKIKKFKIKIDRTDIFFNDPLTKTNTLFFNIYKNENLFKLQKTVVKSLNFKKNIDLFEDNLKLNKTNLISYKKYGYPYVGKHWIPHFSVASINCRRNSQFTKSFLNYKLNYSFAINKIACWKYENNYHKKLFEVFLNE